MHHEGDGDINYSCPWNSLQELRKDTGLTRDLKKNQDHLNHSTAKISYDTLKSPEDLRRLADIQTQVIKHLLELV